MLTTIKSRLIAGLVAAKVRSSAVSPRSQPLPINREVRGGRIAGVSVEIGNASKFYEDNYDPIAFYELRRGGKKTFIGSRTKPRTCRFCSRSEPVVTFSDDAHAVSHMVGNRTLFLAEECDDCNANCSQLENDFGNFTHPDRTWAQVPGKKGVPTLKSFAKSSRVDMSPSGLVITQKEGDEIVDFNPATSQGSFTAKVLLHKYRPLAVYKALLKMALSIMDAKDLEHLRPALKWIATEGVKENFVSDVTRFSCFRSFTSGPAPYPFPTVLLLRRKHDKLKCPYLTFVLLFHNFTYQIFLPCHEKDKQLLGLRATLPMWPHPFMLKPRGHHRTKKAGPVSLASPDYVERRQHTITMGFDSFTTNNPS